MFAADVLMLGYLGGMPIFWPYNIASFILCILYFILILAISSDLEQYVFRKGETMSQYLYRNLIPVHDTKEYKIMSVLFHSYFALITAIIIFCPNVLY